jgi:hypothetical protein
VTFVCWVCFRSFQGWPCWMESTITTWIGHFTINRLLTWNTVAKKKCVWPGLIFQATTIYLDMAKYD